MGAVKLLKQNSARTIINVSSIATLRPSVNLPLYSTFKSALDGTTKPFVPEFGSVGIRANAVLPGLLATPLADAFAPEQILKATQNTSMTVRGNRQCSFVFSLGHSYTCHRHLTRGRRRPHDFDLDR